MNYANLEGGPPTVSHIHFGKRGVNGGIMAFLCGGGGQDACPATTSGTFSGTILPANVQAIANQGTTAGILDELIAAMRSGRAYVNIHNDTFMPGEIRGRIRAALEGGLDGSPSRPPPGGCGGQPPLERGYSTARLDNRRGPRTGRACGATAPLRNLPPA